jgi:aminoglycoside phosphotransferase (APT) family kinase protein
VASDLPTSASISQRASGTPPAEVEMSVALVAHLLRTQHPDFAHLPLRAADIGWDNAMYRLGDAYSVRMPRRAIAATLIANEQRWLPVLAPLLPLPVPTPVRIGRADDNYPWPWSVLPWMPGATADQSPPHAYQAAAFGAFLRALHSVQSPPCSDAPTSAVRGVPLSARIESFDARWASLQGKSTVATPHIQRIWDAALAAPIDAARTWLHGDLHARNVLVENGVFTGVIDWGDLTSGDPATDLASIWMLFDNTTARVAAFAAYGEISAATHVRTRGWAVLFGVMLLDSGLVDHPRHAAMGARVLQRLMG